MQGNAVRRDAHTISDTRYAICRGQAGVLVKKHAHGWVGRCGLSTRFMSRQNQTDPYENSVTTEQSYKNLFDRSTAVPVTVSQQQQSQFFCVQFTKVLGTSSDYDQLLHSFLISVELCIIRVSPLLFPLASLFLPLLSFFSLHSLTFLGPRALTLSGAASRMDLTLSTSPDMQAS